MLTIRQRVWITRITGPVLAIAAFAVYLSTASPTAYPGTSAALVVQELGLRPNPSPGHPIWRTVARAVLRLQAGNAVWSLNVLSATFGALAVWLLFAIVNTSILAVIHIESPNRQRAFGASLLGGATAALFLAFCVPFWIVANRAHYLAFDLVLGLGCVALLFLYARSGRRLPAMLFAFAYGAGMVEFTSFLPLAPIFLFFTALVMYRHEHLRPIILVQMGLCLTAGLCLYLVAAQAYMHTDGCRFRELNSLWRVLWATWRDQYWLLRRTQPGWLILMSVTVAPWAVSVGVGRMSLNAEWKRADWLLHLVITVPVVCLALNLQLYPWAGEAGGDVVATPHVLSAMVYGYVTAYWFLLRPAWLGRGLSALCVALLCVAPLRNLPYADARPARTLDNYAHATLDSMAGRTWLVSSGVLDDMFLLAARERQMPLRIVNRRFGRRPSYRKYVASLLDNDRLKGLAAVDLVAMLRDWIRNDPEAHLTVAVLDTPELWTGSGRVAVPNKLVYLADTPDLDALHAAHLEFWSNDVPTLDEPVPPENPVYRLSRDMPRHISRLANDLGVMQQDAGHTNKAIEAYTWARRICTNNISALLNLAAATGTGSQNEPAGDIVRKVEASTGKPGARQRIWALSRYHGQVRAPQAFARLGWLWAYSGYTGQATTNLERARSLLPEDRRKEVEMTLAGLHLSRGDEPRGLQLYEHLLETEPGNWRAMLGIARVHTRQGRYEQAATFLELARTAGAPQDRAAIEQACLNLAAGEPDKARIVIEEAVEYYPENVRAWYVLAATSMLQGDLNAHQRALVRLRNTPGGQVYAALSMAHMAWRDRNWTAAARHFNDASTARPADRRLLEWTIRMFLLCDHPRRCVRPARRLLVMDPDSALANYVIGCLQMANGRADLAEESLRRSLAIARDAATLNNLAWVLQVKGDHEEAEGLAREAVGKEARSASAWDTLGVILTRLERFEEAEDALVRSLALGQDNTSVHLHRAELAALSGDNTALQEALRTVWINRARLSKEEQSRMERLRYNAEQ